MKNLDCVEPSTMRIGNNKLHGPVDPASPASGPGAGDGAGASEGASAGASVPGASVPGASVPGASDGASDLS